MVTHEEITGHVQSVIDGLRASLRDAQANADLWKSEYNRVMAEKSILVSRVDDLREILDDNGIEWRDADR